MTHEYLMNGISSAWVAAGAALRHRSSAHDSPSRTPANKTTHKQLSAFVDTFLTLRGLATRRCRSRGQTGSRTRTPVVTDIRTREDGSLRYRCSFAVTWIVCGMLQLFTATLIPDSTQSRYPAVITRRSIGPPPGMEYSFAVVAFFSVSVEDPT